MNAQEKLHIVDTINAIITEYGTNDIKSSKVMMDKGKEFKEILTTYGSVQKPGVYSLSDFNEDDIVCTIEDTVAELPSDNKSDKITDYFHNECLIPPINNYYVEFGCYAPVLRIVKANSFLPFFIQGESGNGKCFFYDQKIKVRMSEENYKRLFYNYTTNECFEIDIEIGELFKKLGLDNGNYNTNLYSEINIQVKTPKNNWVDVTSFVKKPKLPMIKILLENNVILKVAEQHIFQSFGKDVFAIDATCIDTFNGHVKIISKEYFGNYDAYDISIPAPHLYYDSNGIIHHNTEGVAQACAVAKRELVCCNVTNETSEEDLMGSFILSNGDMIWKDGPVLVAMRRGAVLLLDECLEENEKVRVGTVDNWVAVPLKELKYNIEYPIVSFNMQTGIQENDIGVIISHREDEVYEITLEDGRVIIANAEHPFICKDINGCFYQRTITDGLLGEDIQVV